jgi:uncharacterized protein
MSTARTRAVVQDFLARFAAGDPAHLTELFAEHVDWQVADNPGVPWIKPRRTRADIAAHYADLAAHTIPEHADATVEAVIVDGTEAAITGRLSGVARATGRAFHTPFALRVTVGPDDRITRMHIHEDTRAVAAACAAGTSGTADGGASDSFKTTNQATA